MQQNETSTQNEWKPPERAATESSPRPPPASAGANPLPSINLPKGGGAIRGIGEKFSANPATGAGSLTVPIYASPGRAGFGPQLSMSYDTGNGNGPFGFGWSLGLPAVTRKTDKGLPCYADGEHADTFILSGAEDLVPSLTEAAGEWTRDVTPSRTIFSSAYAIHRYRPRVEGLFARLERWVNLTDPQDTFWRSISKDNITTWYGKTPNSRIADPADPSRTFSWLMCETYDMKGNVAAYQYAADNSDSVDLAQAHERNRSDSTRSTQRYIKHVLYGNRTPYLPNLDAPAPLPLPTDWCFELVFDYGEHDLLTPLPRETAQPWPCRVDPFSTYRPTFEVRTYRLCRRVLMFHHFDGEPNVGLNCLVRSTDFEYLPSLPPADPSKPVYSLLSSVTQTGYRRNDQGGYLSNALPSLEFQYTAAEVDETVRELDSDSLENLPYGLDGVNYRWADLDGEGLSGILTEQAGSWFYKPNVSSANQHTIDGKQITLARFAPVEQVAQRPSLSNLSGGRQQLLDLSGDGVPDLVQYEGPVPGFYERTPDGSWGPFAAFASVPVVDWRSPNVKFVDLTGDGFSDLLIGEDHAFSWHPSLAADGFGPAQRTPQAFDQEKGPQLVFADGSESIFLADLSGDGVSDLARVRNGEVCYWPNLGYGRFGAKVTMDGSPRFDTADVFDGRRLRVVDIDGSGTADIVYFGSGRVDLYFNQSGNGWGAKRSLSHFPMVETLSSATALDLLGSGTACLVWSSPLPSNARRSMRYIDLMGGQKPHLLVRATNNLGAETVVSYAPSTRYYLADKLAGTPWVTRLPFPVQVVDQVQTYDSVSRNLFVSRYVYHHGYFDGVEREFRGFGRVEQYDTEEFAAIAQVTDVPQPANLDAASHVPPVCTKTWFHTGAFINESQISRYLAHEYYAEVGLNAAQTEAMLLNETVLPADIRLPDGSRLTYDFSGGEMREACRALHGSLLRQEIYALDRSDEADRPYSVSERNYTVEALQATGPNRHGVFSVHGRETIDFRYERKLYNVAAGLAPDPRVLHALTLAVDAFGNVLQSAALGYGRRHVDAVLSPTDQAKQSATLTTYTENFYTNPVLAGDAYRIPLSAQTTSYELIQVQPAAATPDVTNLVRFEELRTQVRAASDGLHEIHFENLDPAGLNAGEPYRRLLARNRTLFRPDDLGAAAGDARALLPLGQLESLALPGITYKLAFTPGLLAQVYTRAGTALLPVPATVLGSSGGDGGGYVDLDGNGHWWAPAERVYFDTPPAIPQERNQALQHFFLPRRMEDAFGNASSVDYDPHDLLVTRTLDPAGNVIAAVNDYRVQAPVLVTDPNRNRTAASFDVLGLLVGTAVMGKSTENVGDSLTGFVADLTQVQIDDFYAADDVRPAAAALLGSATTRFVNDVHRFSNSHSAAPTDPSKWQPVFTATLARETHAADVAPLEPGRLQIAFSYSDGFAREIQKKIQAESGPVIEGGPAVDPRWVGSGWTIFNNKGKPVRKYEPFFSQLPAGPHQFEFALAGVSSTLCYDPVLRVVATAHPNHTYEKVVFDPWQQQTWDVNDTVLQADPSADADVGDFFRRLRPEDYSPTWFAARSAGGLGPREQAAASKTVAHANTPTAAYLDTLGRPFLNIADNAADGKYATRHELDIQNNTRSVTDALGRSVMAYDYDLATNRIHQSSMEAGERWMLKDAMGKAIRAFDSRGHTLRTAYDVLRRPSNFFVLGTDIVRSDARTTAGDVLFEQIDYGEGQANDQALNLRTRVFQHDDAAGIVINMAYDFKGNLLRSSRQFVQDPKVLPNWAVAAPALLADVFVTIARFDALNRMVSTTAPDGSVIQPAYNQANLLETVDVTLPGAAAATSFVTNIDYNARGQRVLIEYGIHASTTSSYDQLTFRLTELTTLRAGFPADRQTVQNLSYTYDPIGNISHIQDDADIQNVVFFNNRRVEPSSDYTYDAIYRLVQASGREQLGLSGGGPLPPAPTSYNDVPRVHLPHPGDGQAMGTYTERYQYDAVGNFAQFIHAGANPANPGWTRSYSYAAASLLDASRVSNRLTRTTISGAAPVNENYTYDDHGNVTGMPQLGLLEWDFRDQLYMTQRQPVSPVDLDGLAHTGERTYYVYDSTGQRVRKATESSAGRGIKERLYLGGFELYREYDGAGNAALERHTLHVMDDKRRVALVETKTLDTRAPAGTLPDAAIRYQFDNPLGTAFLELSEVGDVITYEEYYPYGTTSYQAGRSLAEVSLKRYRYTAKERDEESGLYYIGARYCIPWIGRWSSTDPKGIDGGLNLYVYANANPVLLRDPSGHDPADDPPKSQALQDRLDALGEPAGKVTTPEEGTPPNSSPVTQAGRTNQGPQVLQEGQSNLEIQLPGGQFAIGGTRPTATEEGTGGTGQFPIFQTRLGFGLTPWVSLHLVGTVGSQGPQSRSLVGTRIANSTPGTLGAFVQIGTPDDTGGGVYLGTNLVLGQNPPGTAGNFNTNALLAYSLGSKFKVDLNLLIQYQQFGQVLSNPAANIVTAAPGINFSRAFNVSGGTITPNLELRADLSEAFNRSLPAPTSATNSITYSSGVGITYSNLQGHYSIGLNAFTTHEQRFDETPLGSQRVPQPFNVTILPSISGYF